MAVTAVQSNAIPPGGPTATQPVTPTMTPADIAALAEELMPAITKFRRSSFIQVAKLPDMSLAAGQQSSTQISNVGLGLYTNTEHTAVFTVANSAAGGQTATLGPTFPWNLVTSTDISVNGGASVYSAPGYEGLLAALRNKRGSLGGNQRALVAASGLGAGFVRLTAGTGITFTAGAGLSGIVTVNVAASTNTPNNLTVVWYTREKLCRDLDSMIGALPLQNNNTYATIARTLTGALTGASGTSFPFSALGANTTVALSSYTARTRYFYASIPGDPSLYQQIIGNSYQTLTQRNITVSATGVNALDYRIPQNQFLTALHIVGIDNSGNYLVPITAYGNYVLQYNSGGVVPLQRNIGETVFSDVLDYDAYLGDMPGYLLWDGNNTADSIIQTDDMGWLDCYRAAQPEFLADLSSGTSIPVSFNILRESVVAGSVQTVGG